MPITPTYPGVYVEEIPSGVHTITGVSTSVTAFVGQAKRGPANNKAQNMLSFADFERIYGGLLSTSYMTYAVRQFFLNGGSNAWVIRVAKNAKSASHTFPDSAGNDVLTVTAVDAGAGGNDITVQIDYPDASTFNLTLFYTAKDNPADTRTEKFSNLSMAPKDPRYVESMVKDVSQLVTVTIESAAQNVADYAAVRPAETLTNGMLTSGVFSTSDFDALPNATYNSLQISLDGSSFDTISITGTPFAGADLAAKLTDAAGRIQTLVQALHTGNTAYQHFTCTLDTTKTKLVLTSGTHNPGSSVQVKPAATNDIANQLHLLADVATAANGSLTSGVFSETDFDPLPNATYNSLQISLNGYPPDTISVADSPQPFTGTDLATKLTDAAKRIQDKVRTLKPGNQAYQSFTCTLDATKTKLVLTSGTSGSGSSVQVKPAANNDIANQLHLLTNSVSGILTSGTFSATDLDTLPDATHNSLQISLDGTPFNTISIMGAPFAGADLATKLADAAGRIQSHVQALKPGNQAYQGFTCTLDSSKTKLVLTSGTRGPGSSVQVSSAVSNDIAGKLHLLTNATANPGRNTPLTGGSEDSFSPSDYSLFVGDRLQRTGIYALEAVDLFNLLCLPGVTDGGILMDAAAYCQERRAFLIVDAPRGLDPSTMLTTITGPTLPKTNYAAIYYPWVSIADPLNGGKQRMFPPSGTLAGVYARIDSTRGVWKAPAGTEASLTGVQGAELVLTDGQNGILNPHAVNCLRVFPVYGPVSWGARTLRGDDQIGDDYKYIPVRRLALYIEESLYRGTKWAVFEPNDEPLWSQIRLSVGAFMNDLFRKGAFQGRTPRQAYLVKCDSETTTQNDINLGIVNILVGFAPLKPAEFVMIQIQQLAGQIQV